MLNSHTHKNLQRFSFDLDRASIPTGEVIQQAKDAALWKSLQYLCQEGRRGSYFLGIALIPEFCTNVSSGQLEMFWAHTGWVGDREGGKCFEVAQTRRSLSFFGTCVQ